MEKGKLLQQFFGLLHTARKREFSWVFYAHSQF